VSDVANSCEHEGIAVSRVDTRNLIPQRLSFVRSSYDD
jgi:hypothetical protein